MFGCIPSLSDNSKFKFETMLARQNAAPPGYFDAVAKYSQDMVKYQDCQDAFIQAADELPQEIKELIWSFNTPPQPPNFY